MIYINLNNSFIQTEGFFILILSFLAMTAARGWTGLLLGSLCSTSTQFITFSISDWGTFSVSLVFLVPLSNALSRNSMNQLPASLSICFPSLMELDKLQDEEEAGFLFSSFSETASEGTDPFFSFWFRADDLKCFPNTVFWSRSLKGVFLLFDAAESELGWLSMELGAISFNTEVSSSLDSAFDLLPASLEAVAAWMEVISATTWRIWLWNSRNWSKQGAGDSVFAFFVRFENILQERESQGYKQEEEDEGERKNCVFFLLERTN